MHDTAKALFLIQDYEAFVRVQSESAVRSFAALFPYESTDPNVISLNKSPEIISEALRNEVNNRLSIAGIEVTEARISHLAYSRVVAQQMLKRQQAGAVVAARAQIVEGAVSMVKQAIGELEEAGFEISNTKKC